MAMDVTSSLHPRYGAISGTARIDTVAPSTALTASRSTVKMIRPWKF
jgi:hypothetical protein